MHPFLSRPSAFPLAVLVVGFVSVTATSTAWGQVNPLDFVSIVPITDDDPLTNELGRDQVSINSTSFKNQSILTVGDFQFTPYYRDDGKLLIARRDLTAGTNQWDIRATEFTSFNIGDGHNVAVIGIDGDGYLHLSWGMHNNNLLYTRSTAPVTNNNPMSFTGDTVGNAAAINTMTGSRETSVTYPNFLGIPGRDDLLFNYRTGGSGNGTYRISCYDTSAGTWSFTDEDWVKNTDSSGLTYNAYPHNMTYDSNGGLHASWTFRYNSSSPAGQVGYQTNHNIHYAFSPDDGATWYRDVSGTIPYGVELDDMTSEVIVPIPEGSSLINTGTQAIDAHDRPAIATWWAPRSQDTAPDHRRQYMFVGYDGTDWFTSQITHRRSDNPDNPVPESSLGANHMGRPQLVFDDYNRAYVVFKDADRGGGVTVAYSQAESRDDWEFIDLTSTNLGYYEPTIDLGLWELSRQLHVLTQTIDGNSGNGGSQMTVVQWDAAAAMGRVLKWTGQLSSTWDTTTDNFTDQGANDNFDSFDHVTIDDTAQETDISFSGNIQAGKVVVDTAQTVTFSGPGALTGGSLSVVGGATLELATNGNSYQGPTRVSNATLEVAGNANGMVSTIIAADGGTVVMDPTDASTMASKFEIWPTGALVIGTASSSGNIFPDNPTGILNDGLIRVIDSETLTNVTGLGVIEAAQETTLLLDNPAFSGLVRVKPTGTAIVASADGLGTSQTDTVVEAGGQLQIGVSGGFHGDFDLAGNGGGAGAVQVGGGSNVTFNGNVTLSDSAAAIDVADGSTAKIVKAVSGSGGLTKQGIGLLRLEGLSNYVGPTIVQDGTLRLDGASGVGDTTIRSDATLEGGGLVRGNLQALNGATVRVLPANPTNFGIGVVYEEHFSGAGLSPLNGQQPDTVSSGELWTAHASIADDGENISIPAGSSATLPLVVEDGFVYTLDATVLDVVGDTDWFAIGFLEGLMNGGTSNGNRFISDPTTGKAWMLFRGDNLGSPNQTHLGNENSGTVAPANWSAFNNDGGDIDMRIVLDTTGGAGNYSAEFFAKLPTDEDYVSVSGPRDLISQTFNAVGFAVSHSDVIGSMRFFRLAIDGDIQPDSEALTVAGDMTLDAGATLELEVFSPTVLDMLTVSGNLCAGGTLIVSLTAGASTPQLGDAFDILDFGSASGSFDTFNLPGLPTGLAWNVSNLVTTGELEVVADVDVDDNGDVDGMDFLIIQRSNPALIPAWDSLYGSRLAAPLSASSTSVPEPSSALFLAIGSWGATLLYHYLY